MSRESQALAVSLAAETATQCYKVGGYSFCATVPLSQPQIASLLSVFEAGSAEPNTQPLNGRGTVLFYEIPEMGRVVVKRYLRGGVLRYFIRGRYLRWGVTRGEAEFRILAEARRHGINVPEPLLFSERGHLFYEAWLVTREIPGPTNFAELAARDEEGTVKVIPQLVAQLELLIRNRIFHVDLHPGNVVIDQNGKLFLVDFDKAERFRGRLNTLRDLYLVRWRRAVIKHGLPEYVSELVCPGLRRNFER